MSQVFCYSNKKQTSTCPKWSQHSWVSKSIVNVSWGLCKYCFLHGNSSHHIYRSISIIMRMESINEYRYRIQIALHCIKHWTKSCLTEIFSECLLPGNYLNHGQISLPCIDIYMTEYIFWNLIFLHLWHYMKPFLIFIMTIWIVYEVNVMNYNAHL